ncbi:hypothetical protein ACWC10_18385 [Streptomyces sp. NPDC001595]|uniref:hypothetical protein n=1 Tax=Streptomyces sp. NPDC001532 TaxID=3154520 RepID=UPI0033268212
MKLRHVRAVAVLLGVTVALTGARHSGGGGCGGGSNSSSSSSGSGGTTGGHYDSDDDYDTDYDSDYDSGSGYDYGSGVTPDETSGSGTGGEAAGLEDATVKLVDCVTGKAPYARVEITNPNASTAQFAVDVTFENRSGGAVKQETWYLEVRGADTLTADIRMNNTSRAREATHCAVDEYAEPQV